ncbi:hypothetical protein TNCT_722281 [Trichonephila clavata]|uniref:Uncharacterized protein n=1 Tax=Trichonephila clavata TaxID=2740835 RepID=A0A8X6KLV3_TRICU|nr:hypothetical protein TNCT_722281 [Trichonephila clavata]
MNVFTATLKGLASRLRTLNSVMSETHSNLQPVTLNPFSLRGTLLQTIVPRVSSGGLGRARKAENNDKWLKRLYLSAALFRSLDVLPTYRYDVPWLAQIQKEVLYTLLDSTRMFMRDSTADEIVSKTHRQDNCPSSNKSSLCRGVGGVVQNLMAIKSEGDSQHFNLPNHFSDIASGEALSL